LTAAAHAANDVLFQPELIIINSESNTVGAFLNSLFVANSDGKPTLDLYFFDSEPTIPANDAAWSGITNAELAKAFAYVRIDTVLYQTINGLNFAVEPNINVALPAKFWVVGVAVTTVTPTDDNLTIKLNLVSDQ